MGALAPLIMSAMSSAGAGIAATSAAIGSGAAAIGMTTGQLAMTAGTILSTAGTIQAGNAARATGEYQNKLAEKRALEETAQSTKKSNETRRQGMLVASRARAVGAASGGGIDFDLMDDLEQETELQSMNAIWEGQAASDEVRQGGREALFSGMQQKRGSRIQAGATLLGGAADFKKYE